MDALRRAAKTLARTRARTLLLVLVLALAVGLFAALLSSALAVGEQVDRLEQTYATQVQLRRAGATQMGGGADLLPEEPFANLSNWEHVEGADRVLLVRTIDHNISEAPISIVVGTPVDAPLRVTTHGAEGRATVFAGRGFAPRDADRRVAVIGKAYARTRGLVEDPETLRGSGRTDYGNVTLNGTAFRVVGLFETGFTFGDAQVMVPYETAQQTFGKEDRFTTLWLRVDRARNTRSVADRLESRYDPWIEPLGVDVLADTENVGAVLAGLRDVQRASLLGAGLAGIVAALVVGSALAWATLARTRQIGAMRAIGASARDVAAQLAGEAMLVALIGAGVGLVVFTVAGPGIASLLLDGSGGGGMGHAESPLAGVPVEVAPTPAVGAAMLGVALASAATGSLFPVRYATRLDPVDALRGEDR